MSEGIFMWMVFLAPAIISMVLAHKIKRSLVMALLGGIFFQYGAIAYYLLRWRDYTRKERERGRINVRVIR